MTSLFIGIDWADEDHDVFITNDIGKSLDAFAIISLFSSLDTKITR
jgi:hypothetical protein